MSKPAAQPLSRRSLLGGTAAAFGAAALAGCKSGSSSMTASGDMKADDGPAATKNRINQSVVFWCFNAMGDKWDIETTCKAAVKLGCKSVELCGPNEWPTLKKYGLTCAIAPNGMPGAPFVKGFNNPRYHDEVIARTTEMIDACAEARFPRVIAFNGYKWRDAEDPNSGEISLQEGADNCVKGFKKIVGHAEKNNITICIEMLNTRDGSHPMKGHPGYQGDDIDYVSNIVRRVGSPRLKVLFDIYHVQIMNGDIIRRIEENKDVIGHIHTAGNPGRGELDDTQELRYAPIMKKLLDIGYQGYVGQEFIPTRDPYQGLWEAVKQCDV